MRLGHTAWALIVVVSVLVCGVHLFAQEDVKARKAPLPSVEAAWKAVDAKADSLKSKWGEKKTTLMQGNVKFVHGDTTLTSDLVDYDGNAKTAVSPGALKITDPECDITGDKGFADLNKKLGVVNGNVVMHVKPKLTTEEEKARQDKDSNNVSAKLKEPTTVTCAKLEYQYKAKIATATGGVIFKQEKRTASADKAIYDRNTEKLTLIGHVKAVDEDGQTFSSPDKVTISLKKGDEWMESTNTNASFKIDLD
jgi:lipopolysaccharide assembly outer membrane protein LptD (OstA)